MPNNFKIGSYAKVIKSGKVGQIVALHGKKRVKIQIGNVQLVVPNTDLTETSAPALKFTEAVKNPKITSKKTTATRKQLQTLDLHGRTVAEALELLEIHLSQAVVAGVHEVSVVHGIGSGKVCAAVRAHLNKLDIVRRVDLPENNPGVTRVWIG